MGRNKKAAAAAFAAAALFFGVTFLGMGWNYFVCAILALMSYGGVFLIVRNVGKSAIGLEISGLPGEEERRDRLEEAREDFESIGRSMEAIEDRALKESSRRLHGTAGGILSYLEKHPEKIPAARRFIDYYQETASSLLERYVELQNTGLATEDVTKLKEQARQALLTLNRAFEVQFEKLMQDELMDMDADIRLLKQTMRMEGYEK